MKDPLYAENKLQSFSDIYAARIAEWKNREIQLVRLHEEIVAKREAHLNYSLTYSKSQEKRRQAVELVDIERARQRNERYLQELTSVSDHLHVEGNNPASPRLTTLQSNYWAMVKSLKPLWEKSLEPYRTPSQQTLSQGQQTLVPKLQREANLSARSQRAANLSARSQKSANVSFKSQSLATEPKPAKAVVKKPERKSKKKK